MENDRTKAWVDKAFGLLSATLEPPRHELNELDWKLTTSPDKKRLAAHLSAFANHPGGGFMVFGIDPSSSLSGVQTRDVEIILGQLSNLGRNAVVPPISIDYAVETYESVRLLFVYIPESLVKPVHLRGKGVDKAFIRCGGSTREASRQEVGHLMLNSRTPRWEDLRSTPLLSDAEVIGRTDAKTVFGLLEQPVPSTREELIRWLIGEGFVQREPNGGGYVTNLGAISAARNLVEFPDLSRKAVRVIVYDGVNKSKSTQEQQGVKGYAVAFQGLLQFVMSLLPQSEVIEQALRRKRTIYPEIALREIVANALIHQDFTVTGAGPMIEIFSDRIEISNPGGLLPSKRLDRLIGTQPESRNEKLAGNFRRYKICEERGSGLIKAGLQVELYGLPPIEFSAGPNFFKVTLYSPRTFAQMSGQERLQACYQHAVLKYYSDSQMTNTSLRQRLKMPERQRSMVSALIQEALDANLIKRSDPESTSRKFAEYTPFWA